MKLEKFPDYGLRILMMLAAHAPKRQSVAAIAQAYDLSEHHLAKVAGALVKGGFVKAARGRNGGLMLACGAQDISIGQVLRSLGRDEPVVECFGENRSCRILPTCGLRTPLLTAQEAFYAALDGVSLAEVARGKSALATLLKVSAN
jgi:Rrf2 family transcriptional regulator, nitric oxide-sensitive transcriptional repressor